MLIDEKIQEIQNLTQKKITYAEIASIFNLTRSAVQNWALRKKPLEEYQIKKIDETYLTQKETIADAQPKIKAEYYPDVLGSCGGGAFELSQEHYTVELPVDCFFKEISKVKKYSVINAYGDSMLNTIKDGDKLIIEHTETEPIQDNKIYVFCYDNQIYIKRLINNIDELVVVSDNPDKTIYKTKYISKTDRDNLYLIGQVVGLARNLR